MALSRFYNDPFFPTSIFHDRDTLMFPSSNVDQWMMTPILPSIDTELRKHKLEDWPLSVASHAGSCKVKEDEKQFSFSMEVQGFKAEDMSVKVEEIPNGGGHVLHVSGKHHTERKENEKNMFSSDSKFMRRFVLGNNIDTDNIAASLEDGTLQVKVAKKEMTREKPTAKL